MCSSLWQQIPPPGYASALWLEVTEKQFAWFCMSALVLSLSHRELKRGVGVKCLSSCRCREPMPKNNSSSKDDSEIDKVQQIKIEPSPGSVMAQISRR